MRTVFVREAPPPPAAVSVENNDCNRILGTEYTIAAFTLGLQTKFAFTPQNTVPDHMGTVFTLFLLATDHETE